MIQFSIGPNNKESHILVNDWLLANNYIITNISHNGDHYSEISVFGDYLKCYNNFNKTNISFEHWED